MSVQSLQSSIFIVQTRNNSNLKHVHFEKYILKAFKLNI